MTALPRTTHGEVTFRTDLRGSYLWAAAHHRGERPELLYPDDAPELRPRRGEDLAAYLDRLDAHLVAAGRELTDALQRPNP